MNPLLIVVAAIGGFAGVVTTLYLALSFPAVVIWKIYRKIAKGISITK